MKAHRHAAIRSQTKTYVFWHCVSDGSSRYPCVPMAHGMTTEVETCRCGAWRLVNVNGYWRELGPWHLPEPEEVA